ncbi:MAG: ABC transporter permease [Bacteroidetes bacterium]|nr:MAG: ABC transporter permease [Bacteroidota bacterium]
MLIKIAWRNVWRNRIRSLVVICSIALGLLGGVFLASFSWGMNESRAQNMIETQLSHIQIHTPEFRDDPQVKYFIPQGQQILQDIMAKPEVKAATGRVKVTGMLSSTKGGLGVQIQGVHAESEALVTKLNTKVVEGKYFEGVSHNPILVGQKLAERLKLGVRKKVVLTFQDINGNITAGAFRIAGIYKTINSKYDEANVFVRAEDLQPLLGIDGQVHEVALLLHKQDELEAVKSSLAAAYPTLMVEDWKDLAPDLKLMAESMGTFMQVFMAIFMLGMAFGIINTMLMAVLERTRELGMLMAIGMNKLRVFLMIMLETVFLALVGGPLGIFMAFVLVSYFGKVGIDLSMFAEGLSSFGMTNMVYTYIDPHFYWDIGVMVVMTAMISAIYPAIKALRLKPVEAVRAI